MLLQSLLSAYFVAGKELLGAGEPVVPQRLWAEGRELGVWEGRLCVC